MIAVGFFSSNFMVFILIYHSMFQNNFVTGNKIQLVSKINGRALQVTHPANGGPIVYGNGDLGPDAKNGIYFLS